LHHCFPVAKRAIAFCFHRHQHFDFGYATDKFFELSPWILLLLIPAITMRSLSDEFRTGTFEILQTKPLATPNRVWKICGKSAGYSHRHLTHADLFFLVAATFITGRT
jgi:hypothetical protein